MRLMAGVVLASLASVSPAASQKAEIAAAERAVKAKLREPGSARFIGLAAAVVPDVRGSPKQVVCGKVSARNGRGGMSAAIRFVYFPETARISFSEDEILLDRDELGTGALVVANFCKVM